jgi:hypothetical protein
MDMKSFSCSHAKDLFMKVQEQSMSIDKAADILNVPVSFLEMILKKDKAKKLHHLTAFTQQPRFYQSDLIKIRKLV